ncbi:MAG TPA: hypothetical protein VF403_07890 [Kofleriaceae bacterium]
MSSRSSGTTPSSSPPTALSSSARRRFLNPNSITWVNTWSPFTPM